MSLRAFLAVRMRLKRAGKRLVMTNGCFDVLHPGHIYYLERARGLGDALLVALNSDNSVRALKGTGRPVRQQSERAAMLAALAVVDYVVIFGGTTAQRVLKAAAPDIYVKGGDYTPGTLNRGEVSAVRDKGGRVRILPMLAGHSTTNFLRKLSAQGRGRLIL